MTVTPNMTVSKALGKDTRGTTGGVDNKNKVSAIRKMKYSCDSFFSGLLVVFSMGSRVIYNTSILLDDYI